MSTQNANIKDYSELYAQYNWFSNEYPSLLQEASDEFFLQGLRFSLLGISKNINTLIDKDSYFVTKVRIDKQYDMFFRASESAISILLDKGLGKSGKKFDLNKLTDLEAKIITAFNDFVYNSISQLLNPAPPTLKRANFDVIHLTFVLTDENSISSGKFIITLPEMLLSPEVVTSSGDKFSENDFASSTVDVSLKVGTTRFKLIDVKNIGIDDIVVFDDSDIHHMVLKFKDYEQNVKLNPNLGLVEPFDNDEGDSTMTDSTNLWDSIEVEMSAQFDTVKITLGELKNIERGLVVDLTSIYDNRVTLSVEDKPIAKGELVIVNDRYGVKIDEVIVAGTSQPEEQTLQVEEPAEETEQQNDEEFEQENIEEVPEDNPEENNDEDEFDYSDFELEDEDI